MSLFRPRDLLLIFFTVIAGNSSLSALDIPVELPSGGTIHLRVEDVCIDAASPEVNVYTTIVDPQEIQVFSEGPEVLGQMSLYLQEKWNFHDFKLRFFNFSPLVLSPAIELYLKEELKFSKLHIEPTRSDINQYSAEPGGTTVNAGVISGSVVISGVGQFIQCDTSPNNWLTIINGKYGIDTTPLTTSSSFSPVALQDNKVLTSVPAPLSSSGCISGTGSCSLQNEGSSKLILAGTSIGSLVVLNGTEKINIYSEPSKTQGCTISVSEESHEVESNQNETLKGSIIMSFSLDHDFMGGWSLIPCQLNFVKKQLNFNLDKYARDNIDEIALVFTPDINELYLKELNNPIFCPTVERSNVLRDNLNDTFTLVVSKRGEFLFNKQGQLIQSLNENGILSAYDYLDGKLIYVRHENFPLISVEYESNKVVSIYGLPNHIRCEYRENNLLTKIYDEQGSFLLIAYDSVLGTKLSKIIDDSGAVLFDMDESMDCSFNNNEVSLLFNEDGEIFYYKNAQNIWKFGFRKSSRT